LTFHFKQWNRFLQEIFSWRGIQQPVLTASIQNFFQKIISYPSLMHTSRRSIHFVFHVLKLREPHPKVFVPPSCRCKKFFDYLKSYYVLTLPHSSSIAFGRTDSSRSFLWHQRKKIQKEMEKIISQLRSYKLFRWYNITNLIITNLIQRLHRLYFYPQNCSETFSWKKFIQNMF
jgi:hypothetical protein